jgi:hypothetical protein
MTTYSYAALIDPEQDPNVGATYPYSINAAGQVTGYFWNGSTYEGFVHSNGGYTTLIEPEQDTNGSTYPISINATGQVTGYFWNGSTTEGFIYSNGVYTTLVDPEQGPNGATYTASINDAGQVAGYFFNGTTTEGFVYNSSDGSYTTLIDPEQGPNGFTAAASINATGQVAGYFDNGGPYEGFVYSSGNYTTLTDPGAGPDGQTVPLAINATGQVTGYFNTRTGPHTMPEGFIYSDGVYTTLKDPEQDPNGYTQPVSINDSGQVTGYFLDGSTNAWEGFVYRNGSYTTLVDSGQVSNGYTFPTSINNSGQVTGYFFNGTYDVGFIATPVNDDDSGEQAALSLTVNGNAATPIGSSGAGALEFTVAGLDSEDTGTVTFTDVNSNTVTVRVNGGQADYTANLTSLADGAIATSLAVATDPSGNSFTPVNGNAVTLDTADPTVSGIAQTDPATTNASTVDYIVAFSEAVTGVDTSQFVIDPSTAVQGASIAGVTAIDATHYTVTVNTGTGDGTLALDFTGSNVHDLAGNPMSGGIFQTDQTISGVSGHVTATDLNGDGHPDLVSETPSGALAVMIGNGDGTFQAPVTYAVGDNPNGISVGDLNGDGVPDLVVSDYVANGTDSALLGNGDGTFQPAIVSATDSGYPAASALADLNGDGKPDLIVSNTANRGGVSILLGNGDGTFAPKTVLPSDGDPGGIAVGDLNGDGIPDVAFTNVANGAQDVQVYLGKGDGTFVEAPSVSSSTTTYSASIADLNGDGSEELIFTSTSGSVSVALGKGDGTFQAPISYAFGSSSGEAIVTDVNGDGKLDVVVTNGAANAVSVLLGNGDGTLQPAQPFAAGVGAGWVTAADFNGDGGADLAVADFGSSSLSVLINTPPTLASPTYTIDKIAPQVTVSLDHNQLNLAAETAVVTFAFSEAVTGFGLTSVTASGGSLSNLQTSDGGKTYTATFTAANGVDVANADVGVNAGGYQDLAGNAGSAGDIGSFTVDTVTPTVAVSVSSSNLTLSARTATVTFSFSEAPVSFALANAAVVGGALSNLQKVNATTYTATFTAAANTQTGNASVSVTGNSWQEGNGNPGTGGTTGNFSVDTYDHWANAAGGSWSTASNWGNGVPTASVAAEIDRAGTYTVTISGPAAAYGLIVNDAGATVSDKNSALTLAGAGGSNGALTITAGTFALNGGSLNAGAVSIGSSGTFLVGSSAALAETFSDNGSLIVANTSTVSFTGGLSGSGSVTVKNSSVATFSGTITGSETFTVDNSAKAIITKAIGGTGSFTLMKGGGLEFVSSDSENVTFASGASGTLKLDNSSTFTGKISGLTPNNAVDLADLAYTKAKNMLASYTGNTAGGVLTVGNGSKSVSLNLLGDYTHSTWTLSKDASGGTLVVDPATETPWPEPGLVASSTLDLLSNASGPNSILGFARHGDSILDTLAGANEHIGPDVALLVNYMASAFPMSSGGYGGALTDPSQPAISQHMLLSLPQHT